MSATTITEFLQQLPIGWLNGRTVGYANATALGTVLDGQVERLKDAVKARMPNEAPTDALQYIGNERGLIQGGTIAGPSESDDDFRLRLQHAWDLAWPYAGTSVAVLSQLQITLGYDDDSVYLVQQNGLYYTWSAAAVGFAGDITDGLTTGTLAPLTAPATPSPMPLYTKTIPAGTPWWRFDDKTDFCSRFAIVFPTAPASWTSIVNPPTPTSEPSINEVNVIRKIISQWKNAEATCMGIIVASSGLLWGTPGLVWGAGSGNWGGDSVKFSF